MNTTRPKFRKGDPVTYTWYNPIAGTGRANGRVTCVGKDGKWVEVKFRTDLKRFRGRDLNQLSAGHTTVRMR